MHAHRNRRAAFKHEAQGRRQRGTDSHSQADHGQTQRYNRSRSCRSTDGVVPLMLGGEATTGTVCPRWWNQPIVRVIDANRRD
jgi:hypothetical protein